MKKIFLLLVLLVSLGLYAQQGDIKGFVYDKKTGEVAMFANVMLKGTTFGASTDMNGYFTISNIPVGSYTLVVSFLGYKDIEKQITVERNKIMTLKLFIEKDSKVLETVEISADRQEQKTQIKTSVIKISPKQMKKIPTIGGEPDIAQYLQILPGVVSSGDQGGQLYIRGGAPIQNKVLMDGMTIYNPFHSIGFFSVFDADIISTADVYTGGFNAQYGGRISSIMDFKMRDGNKKKFSGKVSATTFGAKAMFEGPIKKQTLEGNGSSSFILSAKTSYLSQSSQVFYNYVNDGNGLPFDYTDLYGKFSMNAKNGSRLSFFGFNFDDRVTYQALSDLHWTNYGFGTKMSLVPGNSKAIIHVNFAFSDYNISLATSDNLPRESGSNGYNFGLAFTYYLGKNQLDYGIESEGSKTDFNFYNSAGMHIEHQQNNTDLSAWGKFKMTFGKLLLEPGFRFIRYVSISETSIEPRLGSKYNLTEKWRIKLAAGLYSQNLIAVNSDRDVVNLFYGFISSPTSLPTTFRGDEVNSKLQKSEHLIFGTEYDITNRINLNVEGYIKYNSQLININKNKIYDDTPENNNTPDYYKKDFMIESGNAYGIDFLIKYDYKRLYVWFVYSLGFVTRTDEYIDYVPYYDRRHNINFLTTYIFGKNYDWETSIRWNLGSGFAFTKRQGYYEQISFTESIGNNYIVSNNNFGIIYDNLNGGRLPYYHRLDVSVKKKFVFLNESVLNIVLSVTNIYNRKNIFYIDPIENSRVNQLPIMPSLGISYKF